MKTDPNSDHSVQGYSYEVTKQQIREFRKIPVADRLKKLEEMRLFLYKAAPPRSKILWDKFRKGEI